MLYATTGAFENCAHDKRIIKVLSPSIWIHYIIYGKGYYNGEEVHAGQAFIIYKNDVCEYFPDRNEPWSYGWIRLDGADDEEMLKKCGLPSKSGVFEYDYPQEISRLIPALFPDINLSDFNRQYKEAVAKMILSLHMGSINTSNQKWNERWVIRAKEYIASNYHKKLTVEGIAEELHVDRKYLRNLFVKYTGKPTKQYLDSYRMSKAAELLGIKDMSINIVAISVGYEDQLSFSKVFKKHYGISPSEYKKSRL